VTGNSGVISHKDNSYLRAWFNDATDSIKAVNDINQKLDALNNSAVYSRNIRVRILLITDFFLLNSDEIFNYTKEKLNTNYDMPLLNRIVLDYETSKSIEKNYFSLSLPEILYSGEVSDRAHYEFIWMVNFMLILLAELQKKED
jgi:hypothetical protein